MWRYGVPKSIQNRNPVINRKFQSDIATLGVYIVAHLPITPDASFPWSLLLWQPSMKPGFLVFLFKTASTLCSCFHQFPSPPVFPLNYFWNVVACSNLGPEHACHVVWNKAFRYISFFKAESLDIFGLCPLNNRCQVVRIYGCDPGDVGWALPLSWVQRPWQYPLWSGWRLPLGEQTPRQT